MSGAKSKRKGSAFENAIAKFLNECYKTEEFARTPGSGAWMGRSNASKRSGVAESAQETLRGDLITPSDFPFIVECKNYDDSPAYHNLIKGSDSMLDQWLSEVEFDAEQGSRQPMLWFKTSRKGVFVAIPTNCIVYSRLNNYLKYKNYIIISQETFLESLEHISHQ